MKPRDALKRLKEYEKALITAKTKHVAVGLPVEKASSKVYGNGQRVIDIGAHHEYGTDKIPKRSWLRMPAEVKKKEINDEIKKQFKAVFENGRKVDSALGRIGAKAQNVSVGAFRSGGYGKWPKVQHGGTPLFDTGTLRNSITYVIRDKK